MIDGRRVTLGVSGGIAIYKALTIARRLTEAGGAVDVVMTASATQFVRPVTFEALTGRHVATSLWEPGRALDHIELPRATDLIILAPATANLIARAALGLADDLLSALLLAARAPVLVAPAMNDRMFAHPATTRNLDVLRARGWTVVGPAVGPLAEGPSDSPGRMSEPEDIIAEALRLLRSPGSPLCGRRVIVTAGPTRERLDPVRVITNPSSGRMGFAIAEAAYARGADVVLITGPTPLFPPYGCQVVRVESTDDLERAVASNLAGTDVLVMAAAPADYRPKHAAMRKRARQDGGLDVTLEPTPDVLTSTASRRPAGCVTVGFALEDSRDVPRAREKLEAKQLDLIVLNVAHEPGAGFETETNRVTLVTGYSEIELPLLSKSDVAERLWDEIEGML